jgi:hypothetical protein
VRRNWRFGIAAVCGLLTGALIRNGTVGVVVGVSVALSIIVLVERRLHRTRR